MYYCNAKVRIISEIQPLSAIIFLCLRFQLQNTTDTATIRIFQRKKSANHKTLRNFCYFCTRTGAEGRGEMPQPQDRRVEKALCRRMEYDLTHTSNHINSTKQIDYSSIFCKFAA